MFIKFLQLGTLNDLKMHAVILSAMTRYQDSTLIMKTGDVARLSLREYPKITFTGYQHNTS